MKKNRLFLMPLIAATLSLGSCSSDSPDMGGNETPDTPKGDQMYMKVRIGMPKDNGTRADNDGGFKYGTADEQAVQSLGFKFYHEDGTFYGYGESYGKVIVKDDIETTPAGNIDAVVDAVIAVKVGENTTKPAYVVAYVNMSDWKQTSEPNMNEISLTTSNLGINAIVKDEEGNEENKFFLAMTSSNFKNTGENAKDGYLTPVEGDKFKDTPTEALGDDTPVEIYVERIPAKVSVNLTPKIGENIPAGEYKLNFNFDAYTLGGLNTKSYQIKNLDDSWDNTLPWTNWQGEKRCFWAKDINYSYEKPNYNTLVNKSFNAAGGNSDPIYCHENTFEAQTMGVNPYEVQPFLYVMGHYTVTDKDNNVIEKNLYQYAGSLYVEDDMVNIMQNLVGTIVYTKEVDGTNTKYVGQSLSGKVEIVSNGTANGVKLQLTNTADLTDLYTKGTDGSYKEAEKEDVNKALGDKTIDVIGFKYETKIGGDNSKKGHLVYYPILIQHLNYDSDNDTKKVGEYGIVRNHIYEITINKIEKLGIGVFNPGEDIIPEPAPNIKYLAAKIRILSWKVVKQGVDL